MSADNQQGSDFSLVSLDKSQQAASSYTNMSRRARGESDSTLNVNEEEAKEKLAPPPAPKPKKKAESEGEEKKKKKKKAPPMGGEDAVDQSLEDILIKIEEFKNSLAVLLSNASVAAKNIAIIIITPLLPLLNKLVKVLMIPLQFINLLSKKINERMGGKKSSPTAHPVTASENAQPQEVEEEEPEEEAAPDAKTANFSDMIELNINFTDNMKKALYKKKQGMSQKLGAMEEDLIMSNALLAIAECAEFTKELPNPASGIYAGKKIYDIMSNVTKEDVAIFLGFVKAYPGKYIGKEWKISETFATWLINNAPIAE